jgi:hypothetical protein
MKWSGPIKPIVIELPADMHTQVKSEAPLRGKTIREVYIECITAWLEGIKNPDGAVPMPRPEFNLTPEQQVYMDKLSAILTSGDELGIKLITHDIATCFDHLKPSASGESESKPPLRRTRRKGGR